MSSSGWRLSTGFVRLEHLCDVLESRVEEACGYTLPQTVVESYSVAGECPFRKVVDSCVLGVVGAGDVGLESGLAVLQRVLASLGAAIVFFLERLGALPAELALATLDLHLLGRRPPLAHRCERLGFGFAAALVCFCTAGRLPNPLPKGVDATVAFII